MNERDSHPQVHEDAEANAACDIEARSQEVWSLEDGPGWSFQVDEHQQTTVALFPGNGGRPPTIALRTAELSLRFHPSDQPALYPADISFRSTAAKQTTELSLTNQGEVTLWLTPHRQVVEGPVSAPGPPIGQLPEAAQSALSGHPEPKVASKPGFKMRESDQKFIDDFPLGIGEKGKRQWVAVG